MARNDTEKLRWDRPRLRSETVEETLAKPACKFKPPGKGGQNPGKGKPPKPPKGGLGPAFS